MKQKFTLVMAISFILLFAGCSTSKFVKDVNRVPYTIVKKAKTVQTYSKVDIKEENRVVMRSEAIESQSVTTAQTSSDAVEMSESNVAESFDQDISDAVVVSSVAQESDVEVASSSPVIKSAVKKIMRSKKEIKRRAVNQPDNAAGPTDGDTQIVALLLALFLGGLGVHRFYLGDKKWGLIILLGTLGGFLLSFIIPFLGWILLLAVTVIVIIDIIKLIMGTMGPGW